ncbi:MAG: helix-turn-helix domain-containing protein [Asticcacaulis sp.]
MHINADAADKGVYRDRADDRLPDRFDLADILKKTRESRGQSLEDMVTITRVRRDYLAAFEQAAYDVLPPRAFAIGYVKAYARALDLDEEALADMYKREVSEPQTRLHAPSGASLEDHKPNYSLYIGAGLCLVAAIIIWNVLQRQPELALRSGTPQIAAAQDKWMHGTPNMLDGAVFISQPQPASREQDVPPLYATPGLEAEFAAIEAEKDQNSNAPVPVQDVLQMRKAFNPHGAIYGAPPEDSSVTLQATKLVNLILRSPEGAIVFVHALGSGEAYRVPSVDQQNLLVDVSDPTAMEIYYNGEYAGMMEGLVTPVGKLNAHAEQASDLLDARQAAAGQLAGVRKPATAPIAPLGPTKRAGPIPYLPDTAAAPVDVTPSEPQGQAKASVQP